MIRKEKNKSRFSIIGSFLIVGAIGVFTFYNIYNLSINNREEKQADDFINNITTNDDSLDEVIEDKQEEIKKEETYNYVGVLEIPTINFKRGFLEINDRNNKVNKNIQVLENSTMPDIENGLMVIAGHSGTGRTAFFKNLYKLKEKDTINIYYKNIKYTYEVINVYEEIKDGDIAIDKSSESTLVLTTCSQSNKNKQVVVISKLVNKLDY